MKGDALNIHELANGYVRSMGLPEVTLVGAPKWLEEETGKKIGDYFESCPNISSLYPFQETSLLYLREVIASYEAFCKETDAQWELINEVVHVEPWTGAKQAYSRPALLWQDVHENRHLYFYTGDHPHPIMTPTQVQRFRAVHDFFGHCIDRHNGFDANGEERTWFIQRQMYSKSAQAALATETRGRNCWVNFALDHASIPFGKRVRAPQKALILPAHYWL